MRKSHTNITYILIVVNILVFLLTTIPSIFDFLALTPVDAVNGKWWQFFTFMYVHGSFEHILFNMFTLFIFGPRIENEMGSTKFFIFYTIAGIFSAIFHVVLTGISMIQLIGASGAIYGVLTAYGMMFPETIIFVFGLIPLPARLAVIVFGLIELVSGILSPSSGIAHFGHLGGILAGFILVKVFGFGKKKVRYFWE